MLSSGDVEKRYQQEFAVIEIDFKLRQSRRTMNIDNDEKRPEVARYNPGQLRPVMVVLNSEGQEVFKNIGGFDNELEAMILADFISGKHYQRADWTTYRAKHFR